MAGDKRKVQEINAGSMADIAFLLLIFFLVATTMNTDTGLTRVLPPMPDPNQKQEDVKVKERNLLLVFVSKGNNIMAGGGIPLFGDGPFVSVLYLITSGFQLGDTAINAI